MDRLIKRRASMRTHFTKAANSLEAELAKENVNIGEIGTLLTLLENRGAQIATYDEQINEHMIAVDTDEDEYTEEFESQFLYSDKLVYCRRKVDDAMAVTTEKADSVIESSHHTFGGIRKNKYKLPPIELKKFGGDLKDWLQFWSQFEKIHDDHEM